MQRKFVEIAPEKISYHGWHIQLEAQNGLFYFYCYTPEISGFCNDGAVDYPDINAALEAACHFVDRENAIQALIALLNECLQLGKVSEEEYWNLTSFA